MDKEMWLKARINALYDYFDLPEKAKAEAEECFDGMRKLAAECNDQGEFETRLSGSPLTEQYNGLFTKFSKYVKLPEGTPGKADVVKSIAVNTAASSVKTIAQNKAKSILINALPDEVSNWLIYRWNNVPILREIRSFFNLKDSFRRWFGKK